MDRSLRLREAILKGWPSLSPGLVRGTTSPAPTLGLRQKGSTLKALNQPATAAIASTLSETSAKVDQVGFGKPEACDNPSRWLSARSARYHRKNIQTVYPAGVSPSMVPLRGRLKRRWISGGIACRLNHRLGLSHSSGMLKTRIRQLSQRSLSGLCVSPPTQGRRCCANPGLNDCNPVGVAAATDLSVNKLQI